MRFAVVILLVATVVSRCTGRGDKRATDRMTPLAPSAQTCIVLDAAAGDVAKRAFHQGPIEPPQVSYLPCRSRRDEPVTIVEVVIDETGKIVQATVVAGEHGPAVDAAVASCLAKARLTPARMNGHPVAVFFDLTISGRG